MNKITQTQKLLQQGRLDAFLVSSYYNIAYLLNFFGFAKEERDSFLLVTKDTLFIFVSPLHKEALETHLQISYPRPNFLSLRESKSRYRLVHEVRVRGKHVMTIHLIEISSRNLFTKQALKKIIKQEKIKTLGFEKNNLTFAEFEKIKQELSIELIGKESFIEHLRVIKDPCEIASIEKACHIGDEAFSYILSECKEGITEKQLATLLEFFIKRQNATLSFPTIVAFGATSSVPHHLTSDRKLQLNEPILIDFGVEWNGYCSDMTRTFFFGKATTQFKKMYQATLEAQETAYSTIESMYKKHIPIIGKAIQAAANKTLEKKRFNQIPHGLGHGIGLFVHEKPTISVKSTDQLTVGMVFSNEPGIYIPGTGGVRIEDLIVLEQSGPRYLTQAPKTLLELPTTLN